ncbi:sialate O-acetylesterase [Luteolibacter yonseiensis]|uniref:Sialate O-acetylesterase n=1 Tax=Luteolibacter yonseiensis TaxID=1144680 RepID=A0A934R1C2_9BACT|nr:sialate O-acetylesterase [Luteolibacter yonseiensis]MBK1814949.1 sialate O-acetylesterase [Luteolibacter yonseiensis]
MKRITCLLSPARVLLGVLATCCMPLQAEPPTPVAPPVKKQEFHVYLLMGQSNMCGRDTRELAGQVDNPKVLALGPDGKWVVARDPMFPKAGRIEPGAGPGIPFASRMLAAGGKAGIGLVPCAVGGTKLERWVKGGDLYQNALSQARVAAKDGIISGVLWHQGESDSEKMETAGTYEARLKQMLTDLRADLKQPELPIVVGQIGDFMDEKKFPGAETVRKAIRRMPQLLEHVGYADSARLKDKGDKLHFDTDGSKQLGERFAKAMLELEKK